MDMLPSIAGTTLGPFRSLIVYQDRPATRHPKVSHRRSTWRVDGLTKRQRRRQKRPPLLHIDLAEKPDDRSTGWVEISWPD